MVVAAAAAVVVVVVVVVIVVVLVAAVAAAVVDCNLTHRFTRFTQRSSLHSAVYQKELCPLRIGFNCLIPNLIITSSC